MAQGFARSKSQEGSHQDPQQAQAGGRAGEENSRAQLGLSLDGGGISARPGGGGGGGGSPPGEPGPVPYKAELEEFFGQSLDGVVAICGVPAEMAEKGANATAEKNVLRFAEIAPPKELVVHELTHFWQWNGELRGGGGGGAQDGGARLGAEAEAEANAKAFESGEAQSLPVAAQASGGTMRDEATGTPLERLKEASKGNLIGDVDEGACLLLVNQLTPSDRVALAADHATMRNLCAAFDETEMVRFVTAMGPALTLSWKAYWIDIAGESSSVPMATWQVLFATAPQAEQLAFLSYNELHRFQPYLGNPIVLCASIRATATWGTLLGSAQPLMRWLAASSSATLLLCEVAGPMIADGQIASIVANMQATGTWATMVAALPKGAGLDAASQTALRRLAGQVTQPALAELFQVRFNHPLTADPGVTWSDADIRAVWDQLAVLPAQDVSENTVISAFRAISGDQAFWSGGNTVKLGTGLSSSTFFQNGDARNGTMVNPDRLGHTVRHEIGHSVHDQLAGRVNSWLQNGVGFWYLPSGNAGATALISGLGGFPGTYKDLRDQEVAFTAEDQARIAQLITSHSGSNTWGPNTGAPLPVAGSVVRDPTLPAETAATQAQKDVLLWDALNPKVHSCFTLSDAGPWYVNYASLPSGSQGRYFWNHWYSKPYYFGGTAKAAIDATGDNYTAMSEKEFFANCYAEFFKDPAGYNDPTLWGRGLSADVSGFMRSHVLERQPYKPPAGGGAGPNIDNTGV
jgi:hypothetical protein